MTGPFPFHEVVGQEDAKLALLLAATDPMLGGVLLRGDKGSAKTTLARGLARVLGGAPFVELPLSATEDRVVGSFDVASALGGGEIRFRPGLLADADGGVLHVDEINLLPDHLVDVLLDVAVSGEVRVERDGISHRHPARFVLVGSMNPEEGELRPQLLDRFGFCVEVRALQELDDRIEAVRRRLAHDGAVVEGGPRSPEPGPGAALAGAGAGAGAGGASRSLDPRSSRPAALPDPVLDAACRLALEVGAEGLRADLALCRAAAAAAGLDGRDCTTADDLRRIAPLVLAHRARRRPFDPPVVDREQLDAALRRVLDGPGAPLDPVDARDPGDGLDQHSRSATQRDDGSERPGDDQRPGRGPTRGGGPASDPGPEGPAPSLTSGPLILGSARRVPGPPSARGASHRGRVVGSEPIGNRTDRPVAVVATTRAVASRRAVGDAEGVRVEDLRSAVTVAPVRRLIVLCVDLSGSMGAEERARAATGAALGLLTDAYQHRHRVALVGFSGSGAEVLLAPTSSVEVARNRLSSLRTGGSTPLAEGLRTATALALRYREPTPGDLHQAVLVVLTDGRATGDADALGAALEAGAEVRRRGVTALVLDCETGRTRLGLAARLAEAMGAQLVPAAVLEPLDLPAVIRSSLAP